MTNEQIIFNARMKLMEEEKIGTTGRFIEMVGEDGVPVRMPEPEEIHTYHGWRRKGFQVRRGEHAVATLQIWKHKVQKAAEEDQEDQERMFLTKAFFFSCAQVEAVKEAQAGEIPARVDGKEW